MIRPSLPDPLGSVSDCGHAGWQPYPGGRGGAGEERGTGLGDNVLGRNRGAAFQSRTCSVFSPVSDGVCGCFHGR